MRIFIHVEPKYPTPHPNYNMNNIFLPVLVNSKIIIEFIPSTLSFPKMLSRNTDC